MFICNMQNSTMEVFQQKVNVVTGALVTINQVMWHLRSLQPADGLMSVGLYVF